MNKVESTHGIKIANAVLKIKYSGLHISVKKLTDSFRLMRPYFLPKQQRVILDA